MDEFPLVVGAVSVLAGAVASLAGFGIGSLLTPLLSLQVETKLAVAAVSIPHLFGTALRCWILRKQIDRRVVLSFGIASALGGLLGSLVHNLVKNQALTIVFGVILIFSGVIGVTGLNERIRFKGWLAWLAGVVSGGLGGMVGNQGGIRSAALLTFQLEKRAFIATSTAIGLVVDFARMPVYLVLELDDLFRIRCLIGIACAGVVAGTFLGTLALRHVEERAFKRIVSAVVLLLGVCMVLWRQP